VQQAQALTLHDRSMIAHQQNSNYQQWSDDGGDNIEQKMS
jgi:hypothetical protein